MADSIDTYIVSEIFLFFISRYRKNLSGIFQGIPLPKVQPSSREENGKPDGPLSRIRSSPAMGSRPAIGCSNVSISPQLIYAIIIAGVNIPSDSR